jgi:ribonuclease E
MSKEMLINVSEGEECRIALLEDGRLQELYMERTSSTSHVGNIYKGRVTNVEPSIQAAFVDFGLGRNGFLHISDLMPTYFGRKGEDIHETVGRKMARRDRPPIQRCLRRGDEIVVQIIKEGIGTKGPTLSTYLSIPGKMLVMMPGMGKMGVSKKIEDEQERRRLRQILDGLKPPKDVAFIIRTAGIGKTKLEIERDLKYLTRLWETLVKKEQEPAPVELYTEGDLVTRTVRDMFSPDVERIVVDNNEVAKRVKEVIKISSPRAKNRVDLYENPVPLFHQANIEREIEMMYSRHVPLPSGGSLVIDSTEAVVAIDVNSGKFRDHNDAEMTAFKTDMEAADEIPRQLKLRDLGGVIICDFIDLRFERHRRELEERLFENFKNDRAKTKVLRMSQFGIIEITRQRMRPSLKRSIYFDCPHCKGAGLIKTPESLNLDVMRKLAIALDDQRVVRAELSVCSDIAFYLLNNKRAALTDLETRTGKKVLIRTDAKLALDELKFELFDIRDGAIILEEIGMTLPAHPHTTQLGNRPPGHTAQGRGGRRDNRNDRNSNRRGRPLPTRPADDDDDEVDSIEDRANLERGDDMGEDQDPGRRGLEPNLEREEDPTDIPTILETEAGDEVAEELADEEEGGGQHAPPPVSQQPRNAPHSNAPYQQNRPPSQGAGRAPGAPGQRFEQGAGQASGDYNDQNGPREGGGRRRRRRGRRGRGRGGQGTGYQGGPNQGNSNQSGFNQGGVNQGGQGNQQRPFDQYDEEPFEGDGSEDGNREPNGNVNPEHRSPQGNYADDDRDEYDRRPQTAEGSYDESRDSSQPVDENLPAVEGENQPPVRTDEGALGSDQKPRRRRRRGGRRHRRRNGQGNAGENGAMPAGGVAGEQASDESSGESFGESFNDREDSDESEEITAEIYPAPEPIEQVLEPVVDLEPVTLEVEAEVKAKLQRKAEVEPEAVEEVAPKPKAKRASRAKAATPKAVRSTTKRVPPKKTAKAAEKDKPVEVAQPADVVRTGSADKHLISDEPVIPQPLSRPRSYSDLDAIPDDYD